MVQSHMNKERKHYIQQTEKTGTWNYRRGIPSEYRLYFLKSDGKIRGREWKQSLKTKDKARALELGARVNNLFEQTLRLAKEQKKAEFSKNNSERDQIQRFIGYLKKNGLHPEQAPSMLQDKSTIAHWKRKQQKLIHTFRDYQLEFIDESPSFDGRDLVYKPNAIYYLLEEQINFLKGKDSKIIDVLRPTLRSATDEYIAEKVGSDPVQYDKNQKATFDRISRITNDLAIYLGGNSADVGFDYYLDEIERYQVKSWMDNQLLKRKSSTVGRELSVVSAIYNRAATEHSKYSKLKKEANPFSGLRTKAEERHEIALRKREVTNTSSRAWTRSEYDAFVSRLSIMKPQLRIVSLLSMHTGARLKDICGLMIEDIVLNNDSDSLVQYRHNPNREITKDSIERVVPLFGDVLVALRTYIEELKQADRDEVNLFPNYVGPRGSDNASNTLNQRHLDLINKDPRFKVHGLRDTLQAKFLAANVQNQISGYIIGWRSKTTVGMQESYSQDGYPHAQMLAALTKAHSVEVWGNITKLGVKLI